jgi:hypothetical protein
MSENWRDPIEDRIASESVKTIDALRTLELGLNRQIVLIRRITIVLGIFAVLEVVRIGLFLYQMVQH